VFDGRRFNPIRPALPRSITYSGWGSSQVAFQDHAGEWWFATGQGLCRFAHTTGVMGFACLTPKAVYTTRNGLAGDNIFRIFEDSRGDIWIGTVQKGEGLTRWDRKAETLHVVPGVLDAVTAIAEAGEATCGPAYSMVESAAFAKAAGKLSRASAQVSPV
jgi:ligand-binding sensor domain-containing protein